MQLPVELLQGQLIQWSSRGGTAAPAVGNARSMGSETATCCGATATWSRRLCRDERRAAATSSGGALLFTRSRCGENGARGRLGRCNSQSARQQAAPPVFVFVFVFVSFKTDESSEARVCWEACDERVRRFLPLPRTVQGKQKKKKEKRKCSRSQLQKIAQTYDVMRAVPDLPLRCKSLASPHHIKTRFPFNYNYNKLLLKRAEAPEERRSKRAVQSKHLHRSPPNAVLFIYEIFPLLQLMT